MPYALKQRRGAILVMGTVLLLGLMMMAGVAVDASRAYGVREELQRTADAAALAGATQLLRDPSRADQSARQFAAANRVMDSMAVESVRFGVWNPDARTFTPVASALSADAVEVTMRQPVHYLFGPVIGRAAGDVRTTAVSWALAPTRSAYNELSCVKPWGMLHQDYRKAFERGHWEDFSYDDIRAMRDTAGDRKRWFTLKLGDGNDNLNEADIGSYFALDFTNNSGGRVYRDRVTNCNHLRANEEVIIEQGNMMGDLVHGVEEMCARFENDTCYNEQGGVGVPIVIPVICFSAETNYSGGGPKRVWVKEFAPVMFTGLKTSGTGTSKGEMTGYLINMQGDGPVWTQASGLTKPILVK